MSSSAASRPSLMPMTSYTVIVLKKLLNELSIPYTSKMLKADLYELYKSTYSTNESPSPVFDSDDEDYEAYSSGLVDKIDEFPYVPEDIAPPSDLKPGTILKNVQQECVQFMNAREKTRHYGICGGAIALKMGVGKTLATAYASLAISAKNSAETGIPRRPTIIVCSKTVMNAWKIELTKFFPTAKVLFLHTDFISRSQLNAVTPSYFDHFDFVVTSYDIISRNASKCGVLNDVEVHGEEGALINKIVKRQIRTPEMLGRYYNVSGVSGVTSVFFYAFERLIIDESHTISNIKTSKAEAVMAIIARRRWCVTGTLMKNAATDIHSQLVAIGYDGVSRGSELSPDVFHDQKLGHLIFAKEDVETVLPPIKSYSINVNFTEKERAFYENISKALYSNVMASNAGKNFAAIFAEFTRLRQCCCSAALLYGVFNKLEPEMEAFVASNGARFSSKYRKILQIIQYTPPNEQVIVFSSFSENLDIFRTYLNKNNISNITIDGSITGAHRNQALESFKAVTPFVKVLLMTYKVGSEGLTITNANHVILCEPWWNHATHRQAIARVHRTGQTRTVSVYKIVCRNSIEEHIYQLCEEKSTLESDFGDGLQAGANGMDIETIRKILRVDSIISSTINDEECKLTCMICHGEGGEFPITACACKEPSAHTNCLKEWLDTTKEKKPKCFLCRSDYKLI